MAMVPGVAAMNTTRLTALWRRLGVFVIPLAAVAGGVGVYAVAQAFGPRLLVWWPWLLSGVAGLAIYGAWWLWWGLPKHQADRMRLGDPKERADAEDNIRKTIGQLLGGAAVLLGAAFAYLQFQQQQTSAHDLLISNQVAKGFELLGNKDNQIQQRLGGIYALEGVMNTSKEYYQPVLEALCAFIRDEAAKTSEGAIGSDILAALNVIGRRVLLGKAVPDLRGVRLPKADLAGVNLTRANLYGANLAGAKLLGVNLTRANLNGANLAGAKLFAVSLTGANLDGASLTGATLFAANLTDAYLTNADLTGAYLTDAILTADLTGAILTGAILTGAILTQAQLDTACGKDVTLDPGLTIKPCPATPVKPQ
jgi:uncharacterized protein YjbI with pentapeptide repeats